MFELLNFYILITTLICCSRNPMYTVFSFIALTVFLFIFLIKRDVEFIANAFLIIYIGAIMVLFLFAIILQTAQLLLPSRGVVFQLSLPITTTIIPPEVFFLFDYLACKNNYLCTAGGDDPHFLGFLNNPNLQIKQRGNVITVKVLKRLTLTFIVHTVSLSNGGIKDVSGRLEVYTNPYKGWGRCKTEMLLKYAEYLQTHKFFEAINFVQKTTPRGSAYLLYTYTRVWEEDVNIAAYLNPPSSILLLFNNIRYRYYSNFYETTLKPDSLNSGASIDRPYIYYLSINDKRQICYDYETYNTKNPECWDCIRRETHLNRTYPLFKRFRCNHIFNSNHLYSFQVTDDQKYKFTFSLRIHDNSCEYPLAIYVPGCLVLDGPRNVFLYPTITVL